MDVVVDDGKSPPLLHLTESEISPEEEEAIDREKFIHYGLEGDCTSNLEEVEGVVKI